ncbi:hypothetical protein EYF80_017382 [Liparis tanakae]|uniref:Uncharacterized protein n=1 Tax=Liparis tanakae TaxID=230148 RepID=A0A4Z2I541_9TELE|nr:hypothetical protein EYF80_017382 [Liparis tanakae]
MVNKSDNKQMQVKLGEDRSRHYGVGPQRRLDGVVEDLLKARATTGHVKVCASSPRGRERLTRTTCRHNTTVNLKQRGEEHSLLENRTYLYNPAGKAQELFFMGSLQVDPACCLSPCLRRETYGGTGQSVMLMGPLRLMCLRPQQTNRHTSLEEEEAGRSEGKVNYEMAPMGTGEGSASCSRTLQQRKLLA